MLRCSLKVETLQSLVGLIRRTLRFLLRDLAFQKQQGPWCCFRAIKKDKPKESPLTPTKNGYLQETFSKNGRRLEQPHRWVLLRYGSKISWGLAADCSCLTSVGERISKLERLGRWFLTFVEVKVGTYILYIYIDRCISSFLSKGHNLMQKSSSLMLSGNLRVTCLESDLQLLFVTGKTSFKITMNSLNTTSKDFHTTIRISFRIESVGFFSDKGEEKHEKITRFGRYGLLMISSFSFSTMSIDPFILHGRGGLQSGLTPLNLPVKEKKNIVHVGWVCMSMTLSVYHWNSSMNQGSTVNVTSNFTPQHLGPEQLFFFSYVCLCWLTSLNILGRWRIVWMIADGMMVWMLHFFLDISFEDSLQQLCNWCLKSPTWIKDVLESILQRPIRFPSMHKWWRTPHPGSTDPFWVVVSNIFYFHPYLRKRSNLTNIQMGWFNHQVALLSNTFFFGSSTFFLGTFLSETSSNAQDASPRSATFGELRWWADFCRRGWFRLIRPESWRWISLWPFFKKITKVKLPNPKHWRRTSRHGNFDDLFKKICFVMK